MMCFACLFGKEESSKWIKRDDEEEASGIQHLKVYNYKELRNATNDFSYDNKIGEGGFGSVYKGMLKGGMLIAVKVLSAESKQGAREFLNEITVLSKIEHENLVKLHGCCVERDHRILVYDFIENNSLSYTLLGGRHNGIDFNWEVRSKICVQIARGMAFLHEEVKPRIVHRDIKASNILLDKDLNPKISDFGLARLIPSNATHVSTRVAGTMGYLAPEYAIQGQLTRKADVYSFGVLLLEIVSGRCNYNCLPSGEQFLLERVWELYEADSLLEMVDSTMVSFDPDEAVRFLRIALLCTQDMAKRRPSMSMVIKMLTKKADVNDEITKPGLISDFMDLKVKHPKETSSVSSGSAADQSRDDAYSRPREDATLSSTCTTTAPPTTFTSEGSP